MASANDIVSGDVGAAAPKLSLRVMGLIAVAFALISATLTFAVLAGLTPIAPTHQVVVTMLAVDAFAALLLTAVIGREIWNIMQARRHGRAGARLHVRIIGLFSVIAAVPTVLVAIVATITLDRGLAPWFSDRIQSVIQQSLTVAQLYLNEQGALIRSETAAMAVDMGRAKPLFDSERERFKQLLDAQAKVRGLPLALIVHSDLTVIERANVEGIADIAPPPASGALSGFSEEVPNVAMFLESKTVAAVIKLRGYDDAYLYVARPLDPRVIEQLQVTQELDHRVCQSRAAPRRRAGGLRADVHGDLADRAVVGGVDRAQLRQPAGGADPPPDQRGEPGVDRQSLRAGAGAARGRRPFATRRELQQDDPGAAHAA